MNPNPADMLVFLEVVEARSFTGAADRLGRTKSAVSQTVTRLEDDLGCKLLYRSTRTLSLTEAGTRFHAHCRELRHTYDTALTDTRNAGTEGDGLLTVTAPHALSAPLMLPVITDFTQQFPKVQIRLFSSDTAMNLAEARIDLAVRVGEPKQQGARVSRLGNITESLYASPGYIAQQPPFTGDLSDLAGWDHIANDWQGNPVSYDVPKGERLKVKPRIRCNTLPDVHYLAIAGAGIALLPDIVARDAHQRGTLQAVMPMGAAPVFSVHEFGRHPPGKVKTFIEMLRARLKIAADTRQRY